jgi:hypothetical protein
MARSNQTLIRRVTETSRYRGPVPAHVPELVDYLNRAFDELVTAGVTNVSIIRLRLGTYLDALSRLRDYRQGQLNEATQADRVWERLVHKGMIANGQYVEGNLVARNNQHHSMTKMAAPAGAPLYPSEQLIPSDYLYPGENLMWLRLDELDEPTRRAISAADRYGYFGNLLAGLPVLPAADVARRCLAEWEGFGRLSDATYMAGLRVAAYAP